VKEVCRESSVWLVAMVMDCATAALSGVKESNVQNIIVRLAGITGTVPSFSDLFSTFHSFFLSSAIVCMCAEVYIFFWVVNLSKYFI
jgi:hypothetical protein